MITNRYLLLIGDRALLLIGYLVIKFNLSITKEKTIENIEKEMIH